MGPCDLGLLLSHSETNHLFVPSLVKIANVSDWLKLVIGDVCSPISPQDHIAAKKRKKEIGV